MVFDAEDEDDRIMDQQAEQKRLNAEAGELTLKMLSELVM